jgi:hypothetical protein
MAGDEEVLPRPTRVLGIGSGASWPISLSVNAPSSDEVEYAIALRLGEEVEQATYWFLWNTNLSEEEHEGQYHKRRTGFDIHDQPIWV